MRGATAYAYRSGFSRQARAESEQGRPELAIVAGSAIEPGPFLFALSGIDETRVRLSGYEWDGNAAPSRVTRDPPKLRAVPEPRRVMGIGRGCGRKGGRRRHDLLERGDRFGSVVVLRQLPRGYKGRVDERVEWRCDCGFVGQSFAFNLRGRVLECTHRRFS